MSLIVSLLLGAAVGWLASWCLGRGVRASRSRDMVVGTFGALVGAAIVSPLLGNGTPITVSVSLSIALVAVATALVLLMAADFSRGVKFR